MMGPVSTARPIAGSRPEDRLLELIDEEVSPDRAQAVRSFARAYLKRLGGGDSTEGIAPEALLGEILSLYEFACARDGEAMAVRAFNPTREKDGYEPVGSVLETNTDDLPFLVDSVSGELSARGFQIARMLHPIIATEREGSGRIRSVRDPRGAVHRESVMHFDLDRRLGDDELDELEDAVRATLTNVRAVVRDFPAMLERTNALTKLARAGAVRYEADEVEEVVDFLAWLQRGNFVYLGAREYDFTEEGISLVHGSGLGILAERISGLARLLRGYAQTALEDQPLWHERDISHSSAERVILPDATILLDYMLVKMTGLIEGLVVRSERMRENIARGLGLHASSRVLVALVEKGGVGRDEAYAIVQRAALRAADERAPLRDLLAVDPVVAQRLPLAELDACFDEATFLRNVHEVIARLDTLTPPVAPAATEPTRADG